MPEFVPLAQLLRPQSPAPHESEPTEPIVENVSPVMPQPLEEKEEAMREVRHFYAHLREALDRGLVTLLVEIAREIVCRELLLAPVEIANVVHHALQRYRQCEPLRVRAHGGDLGALSDCEVPVFADDTLRRGDVVVELRNGSVDLSLETRLEDVIAKVTS